ncbi:hypothetical protein EV363DRAFT_1217016 [Boletus edulis]|uniref:Uncharacterized protein n=1 Tax=Boletus edulis BED1 TaxID=1328754 RepID=A0AAD4BPK9_BOLED|nr:hypothetical protein EV363DRAFT_1217016 [Boletus edulis]KAF8435796.1 hypothetical protein L210DRAFT_3762596 [Boletus edulis BED1]
MAIKQSTYAIYLTHFTAALLSSMPSNPDSALAFKISTGACGTSEATRPVGINHITPAFQNVRLDEPIQTWKVNRIGDHLYLFGIGGYPYTGMRDDKVAVSIYPEDGIEWHATYKSDFNAYTIEPAGDQSKGWTVSAEYSTNPHIVVEDIKYDDRDLLKYQLFCFEATHN